MKLFDQIKKPCRKCPYKLKQIHTTVNPCPQCKLNGYKDYEQFFRMVHRKGGGD